MWPAGLAAVRLARTGDPVLAPAPWTAMVGTTRRRELGPGPVASTNGTGSSAEARDRCWDWAGTVACTPSWGCVRRSCPALICSPWPLGAAGCPCTRPMTRAAPCTTCRPRGTAYCCCPALSRVEPGRLRRRDTHRGLTAVGATCSRGRSGMAALLIESIAAAKTMNAQSIRISQTATGVGMMSALRDARTNPTSRAMRAVNAGSAVALVNARRHVAGFGNRAPWRSSTRCRGTRCRFPRCWSDWRVHHRVTEAEAQRRRTERGGTRAAPTSLGSAFLAELANPFDTRARRWCRVVGDRGLTGGRGTGGGCGGHVGIARQHPTTAHRTSSPTC